MTLSAPPCPPYSLRVASAVACSTSSTCTHSLPWPACRRTLLRPFARECACITHTGCCQRCQLTAATSAGRGLRCRESEWSCNECRVHMCTQYKCVSICTCMCLNECSFACPCHGLISSLLPCLPTFFHNKTHTHTHTRPSAGLRPPAATTPLCGRP